MKRPTSKVKKSILQVKILHENTLEIHKNLMEYYQEHPGTKYFMNISLSNFPGGNLEDLLFDPWFLAMGHASTRQLCSKGDAALGRVILGQDELCRVTVSSADKPTINHLGVSKNNGTPKSSILIGLSTINHPFWGTPSFGNTHLLKGNCTYRLIYIYI